MRAPIRFKMEAIGRDATDLHMRCRPTTRMVFPRVLDIVSGLDFALFHEHVSASTMPPEGVAAVTAPAFVLLYGMHID